MLVEYTYLLWYTAIVFTICSFIPSLRRQIVFPIFSFIFWSALAMSFVQIDFVGFGSMNVITYNHELGDWYGDTQLVWLLHGVGMIMALYSLYNVLLIMRGELDRSYGGDPMNNYERL